MRRPAALGFARPGAAVVVIIPENGGCARLARTLGARLEPAGGCWRRTASSAGASAPASAPRRQCRRRGCWRAAALLLASTLESCRRRRRRQGAAVGAGAGRASAGTTAASWSGYRRRRRENRRQGRGDGGATLEHIGMKAGIDHRAPDALRLARAPERASAPATASMSVCPSAGIAGA